jgi:hypothetical protein
MTKPNISTFNELSELLIHQYERYLPTAFNEGLTLLQKLNKIIQYLNESGKLVNDVVKQWNEVFDWVMGEGLSEAVKVELDSMLADGTFDTLINETIFNDLNTKINKASDSPVSISFYGAKGDGVTNDHQAFVNAIASGNVIELKDDATYLINNNITVNNQNLRFICEGHATVINNTNGTLLNFVPALKIQNQLSGVTLTPSMYKVTLANVTGVQVGDLIKFKSSAPWYYDPRPDGAGGYSTYKGEVHLIKEINGNEITLDSYFGDTYNTNELIDVFIYSPKTIELKNITFKLPTPTYTQMFYIYDSYKPKFENVNIVNSQRAGAIIYTSFAPEIKGCHVNLNIFDQVHIDTGYGFQDMGCVHGKYHHNTFTGCRRGIDFSGAIPSRWGVCDSNTFASLGKTYVNVPGISGFGTHGGCENTLFSNNIVNGAESAFIIRGNMCKVIGNIGINIKESFTSLQYGGQNYVESNTVQSDGDVPKYFVSMTYTIDGIRTVIKNNNGKITEHVVYHYAPETVNLEFDMSGNVFNTGTDKKVIFVSGVTDVVTFRKSNIYGNQVIPDTRYRYNVNNLLIDWATTEIEGYILPSTFYKVVFGAGSLANTVLNLTVNKRGRIVQLTGEFKFDVTGDTARPCLTGLPNPNAGFAMHRLMLSTANTKHILQKVRNTDELVISGNDVDHLGTFAVGANYAVIIDMSYHLVG